MPSEGGVVLPGAVQAGRNKDGMPLYVGRVFHEGTSIVGMVIKLNPSSCICVTSFFLDKSENSSLLFSLPGQTASSPELPGPGFSLLRV